MSAITMGADLTKSFGAVRDQEGRETCLAFATSDAHAAAIGGTWSPLSCEYLFYHAKKRDKTAEDEGTTVPAILEALKVDGQPVEAGWPYLKELPDDLTTWKPPAKVGTVFRREMKRGGKAFDAVWKAVEANTPVLVGMTLSEAFFTPDGNGVVDSDEKEDPAIKHAIIIIATGTRTKARLLLARNSWGEEWGSKGHAWLAERYVAPRIKVAMTIH
jgi:hypothetical protein